MGFVLLDILFSVKFFVDRFLSFCPFSFGIFKLFLESFRENIFSKMFICLQMTPRRISKVFTETVKLESTLPFVCADGIHTNCSPDIVLDEHLS